MSWHVKRPQDSFYSCQILAACWDLAAIIKKSGGGIATEMNHQGVTSATVIIKRSAVKPPCVKHHMQRDTPPVITARVLKSLP